MPIDNLAQLRRHDVQPFRAVLADLVHDTAAAGADQVFGLDDIIFVTPEQRHRGEEVAVLSERHRIYEAARAAHPERWSGKTRQWTPIGSVWLPLTNTGQGDGQVLKRQLPLIFGQLFRTLAMQGVVQFGNQMPTFFNLTTTSAAVQVSLLLRRRNRAKFNKGLWSQPLHDGRGFRTDRQGGDRPHSQHHHKSRLIMTSGHPGNYISLMGWMPPAWRHRCARAW